MDKEQLIDQTIKNGEKLINSAEDSLEEHNCTHIRNILKNFFNALI